MAPAAALAAFSALAAAEALLPLLDTGCSCHSFFKRALTKEWRRVTRTATADKAALGTGTAGSGRSVLRATSNPITTNKLAAFNKANENALVSAYNSGRAHPGKIIRKLSCDYFL